MTITFSFDNPRECVEVQEFFHNNQMMNLCQAKDLALSTQLQRV